MRTRFPIAIALAAALSAGCTSSKSPTSPSSTTSTTPAALSIVDARSSISVQRFSTFYRVTGSVDVTLNRAISPAPSRVRAEWETSMVGGSTMDVSGRTQLHFDINQDTVACPRFPTSGDFLRLVDVDRLVTLTRTSWGHTGAITTLCG